MIFNAEITVMPLKELLDPQGKAILSGLSNLGLKDIEDVRMGKHIVLRLIADSESEAKNIAEQAAAKLLANQVMEEFSIEVFSI